MIKEFPTLYAVTSTGDIKQWAIEVFTDNDGAAILRKVYGKHEGKLQINDKPIKGKNIGKSNETTPFEQACSNAKSAWKKKKDKNYVEHIPSTDETPSHVLPMLAHPYQKRKHNIIWPAYVQPKLNGVRCLATKISDTEMDFRSRKGKSYNNVCGHMEKALLQHLNVNDILDGELYNHDWTFQQITRHSKKIRNDQYNLQYWIYDMAIENSPFDCRIDRISQIFPEDTHLFKLVDTSRIGNDAAFKMAHFKYVYNGFEGAIIRNANGLYKFGHRSADLQKYKEFIDKEFKIVGGHESEGSEKGCVIFDCSNGNGKTFGVRPKGSVAKRQQMFLDLDKLIGKGLTVRYQETSESGIPIFPVGLVIRDYE